MTTKPALGKTKKPNTKAIKSTPKSAFITLIVNMMRKKTENNSFHRMEMWGTVGDFVTGVWPWPPLHRSCFLTARFHFPEAPAMKPQARSNHGWECLN